MCLVDISHYIAHFNGGWCICQELLRHLDTELTDIFFLFNRFLSYDTLNYYETKFTLGASEYYPFMLGFNLTHKEQMLLGMQWLSFIVCAHFLFGDLDIHILNLFCMYQLLGKKSAKYMPASIEHTFLMLTAWYKVELQKICFQYTWRHLLISSTDGTWNAE